MISFTNLSDRPADTVSYESFLDIVEGDVRTILGSDCIIERRQVIKNNSVTWDCLVIREAGYTVAPTIYLNGFYPDFLHGRSIDDISATITTIYRNNRDTLDISSFEDFSYEHVRDKIIYKLVNYSSNKDILAGTPFLRYRDLAVTFHLLIVADNGCAGTIRISDEQCESWGIDIHELKRVAEFNTPRVLPARLTGMAEMLSDMLGEKLRSLRDDCPDPEEAEAHIEELIGHLTMIEADRSADCMLVLTTKYGFGGAACLLYRDVLADAYRRFGEDFYILPSSVNEVILVPGSMGDPEQLREMVATVNRTEVEPMDVLSDSVYHYPEDSFEL